MKADVSLSYRLSPDKVPHFYEKFRSDDIDAFTHGFLRNVTRDAFSEVASHYSVDEAYGPKKEQFINDVRKRIEAQVAPIGVIIEQFGFINGLRPPDNVVAAINAKIQATQEAAQAQNKVAQIKAEADQRIAAAKGVADSIVLNAEAQAKANRLLSESTTAGLIELKRIQVQADAVAKWDGKRPMIEGGTGGGLLLQVPAPGH